MKIRNFAIAILATAALAGCATGYSYRGGPGDYYYGRPSVDYYGYGAPYGSIGYGYPGGWNGSLGYGYGYGGGYPYGYPYGYYGYGYGYSQGYPYYPYPRNPRSRNVERPDRNPQGYPLPDNGVRYQSRYRNVQGNATQGMPEPQYQRQGSPTPVEMSRYPSRYPGRVQQVPPSLEARGPLQRGTPVLTRPPTLQAPRNEPRFESRAPRVESAPAPARSSFRDRDDSRDSTP